MESEISEPSRQGWMRTTMSKMSKINKWADRYFVLHGATLYYYLKNTDTVMFIMITLSRYIFTQVTIRVINSVDITM
jgi:PH domain